MRTTSLYLALGIAPLVICVPVPSVLVDTLERAISRSGHQHPPASVLNTRPPHALPQTIHWGPDEDDANFETVIDNRPITPSEDSDPSVVLQAPRPIVTDYLMAISVKKQGEKDGEQVQKAANGEQQQRILVLPIIPKKGATATIGDEESISVAEMDIVIPVTTQRMKMSTTPCDQPRYISREQSDIIIICLAVVFLFAVVLLETFGSFSRRRQEGAIKLEREKAAAERSNSNPRTLSIQADQQ